jgi:hypothetical protein
MGVLCYTELRRVAERIKLIKYLTSQDRADANEVPFVCLRWVRISLC